MPRRPARHGRLGLPVARITLQQHQNDIDQGRFLVASEEAGTLLHASRWPDTRTMTHEGRDRRRSPAAFR